MRKSINISDLEVDIAPCGASDSVSGPECMVILFVISMIVYIQDPA